MKRLLVNGVELATIDRGAGSPVLFVHGFPFNHAMWDAQVEALADRHRLIAPDLRGFGASSVTEGKVPMDQLVDDLAGLLDALEIAEPVTICGLSMGGYLSLRFWRRHRARLRAMVLCDARAAGDTPEAAANRRKLAERVLREGAEAAANAMVPNLLAETTSAARPEVVEAVRQMILANDPRGIAATAYGMAERPDMTSFLSEIDCPTALLVGQSDLISSPTQMRSMAEAIPDAVLVEISDAGHLSPMENPTEVNASLAAFLAEAAE